MAYFECTNYILLAKNVLNVHDLRTIHEGFSFDYLVILNQLAGMLVLQI